MERNKEWQWSIDAYKEHIKETEGFKKEDKGMRGTQIHYEATGKYDVIDIIQDYKLNFNKGNVVKYLLRCGKKDDELQELNKAKDYIEREIQHLKEIRDRKNEEWRSNQLLFFFVKFLLKWDWCLNNVYIYIYQTNKMDKEAVILKLENQIFIAKLYGRDYSVKDLEEVLTFLKQN